MRRIPETALAREFTRARPADFRRIEAHLAQERQALESGDAQARNRLLGDFHLLLAEIVGNQVLRHAARAAGAQRRHHRAVPEHARRRLFLARAPCLHPGRARKGDADAASALMDEHLRHAGRPGFPGRRARRRRPGHRAVALTRVPRPLDPAQGAALASRYSVTCSRRPPDAASRPARWSSARARTHHTRMPGDAICTNTS